jgi:hypothetical protein
MLVGFTITFLEAMAGTHVKDILTMSHRWIDSVEPDPDGVKARVYIGQLTS